MFDNFNFELLQTLGQIVSNNRSDMQTLRNFAQRPDNRDHFKLTIGSQFGPSTLPILDVERALVFGGGAGIGDDFWLALDLRGCSNDPPVVGNCFDRNGCLWVEVAPSFSCFCQELSINIEGQNTA